MLESKAGAIHYIIGQIDDIYASKASIYGNFSDLLERILKKEKGYQRVLVFKEKNGDLRCDYKHGKINPHMSQKDIDRITKYNKRLIISKNKNSYKDYKSFIIGNKIEKEEFDDILKCTDIKTAIIFPWEMKNYINEEVERYLSAFQHNIDTDNIIIFQFHNIGQLDEFAKKHPDIMPEYYLVNHSHKDNEILEEQYTKVLQDRITLLNSVGIDEIKNLLHYYNLHYGEILTDKEINKLSLLIKNDMELNNSMDRVISMINYHSQMPLYAIEESIKKDNMIKENLKVLKDIIVQHNRKEHQQQLVGIDSLQNYIKEIKQSYDKIEETKNESFYQLQRLNNVKKKTIPDYLKQKMNLILLGNPGTGKTTIARNYGYELKKLGLIENGNVIEASKSQLKGEYVGQSVAKTNQMIKKAQGGILFIDEIYNFASADETSVDAGYEQEILDTILVAMTNPSIDVVFVFAGYETKSLKVIRSYEGLESRFGKQIVIPDYSIEDLYEIFNMKVKNDGLICSLNKEEVMTMIKHWMLDYKMNNCNEWANVRTFNSYFYSVLKNSVRNNVIVIPESFHKFLKSNELIMKEMNIIYKKDIQDYIDYCKYPLSQNHLMICDKEGLSIALQIIKLLYLNDVVSNPLYYYIDGIEELSYKIDLKNYQFVIIDHLYKDLTESQCHVIYKLLNDDVRCIFIGDKNIINRCLNYYRLKNVHPYIIDTCSNDVMIFVNKTLVLLKDFELEDGFKEALYSYYERYNDIELLIQRLLRKAVKRDNKYQLFIKDLKENNDE